MSVFSYTRAALLPLLLPRIYPENSYIVDETPTTLTATSAVFNQFANVFSGDNHFLGGEIACLIGSDIEVRRITAFASDTCTLTFNAFSGTPANTSAFRAVLRAPYRFAQLWAGLERVPLMVDDDMLIEQEDVSLCSDGRTEYPLPQTWVYLNSVELDRQQFTADRHWPLSSTGMTEYAINNGASTAKRAQIVRFSDEQQITAVFLLLRMIGTVTSGFTVTLETTSSGLPTGTVLANGTATIAASALSTSFIPVKATFSAPVIAARNTDYAVVLTPAYSQSGTNYVEWKADTAGGYGYGSAAVYSGSWALATGDHLFRVVSRQVDWRKLSERQEYDLVPSSTRALMIKPRRGLEPAIPIRLRGQGPPSALTGDTSNAGINAEFVIEQTAANVLKMIARGQRAILQDALVAQKQADELRKSMKRTTGQGLLIEAQ